MASLTLQQQKRLTVKEWISVMIDVQNHKDDRLLEVKATETLTEADFDHVAPVLKKHTAENTEPRLLLVMEQFKGWENIASFWKDLQMDAEYLGQFDRIAIVGDAAWEEWLTKLLNPLTANEIKFFDPAEITHARKWL